MPKYKMIALTKPVEGKEAEYHEWYNNVHLPEICAMPGVTGAQRYKLAVPLQNFDDRPFLAVYDIETDNIMETLGGFQTNPTTQSDASDSAGAYTVIFEEFGERVNAK